MTPKAFIFDVFGTLVDWRSSVTNELSAIFVSKGIEIDAGAVAVAWRDQYEPAMAPIRNGTRAYQNLDILHRENLFVVLERFGVKSEFSEKELGDMARIWERLNPWDDVKIGMKMIRELGLVAPCSNGSISLMAHLARHAELNWDCILGAEIAQDYKPAPQTYLASCRALQLPPEEVMMIAAHNSDLAAAAENGLQTGFMPRPDEHADASKIELFATGNWTVVGADLIDLAQKISTLRK